MTNNEIIEDWLNENRRDLHVFLNLHYDIVSDLNSSMKRQKEADEKLQKDFKDFATTLLSKLNRLDRDNIRQLIWKNLDEGTWNYSIRDDDVEDLANQILTLIPPEGEVIAEGEIDTLYSKIDIRIGNEFIVKKFFKYQGKKGKLIFIEDKE